MANKKLIYGILVVVIAIVGISLLVSRQKQQSRSENFIYNFKECEGEKSNSIELSQIGDSLKFAQILNTYCESQKDITIKYTLSGKNIEIREIFSPKSGVAKCICPIGIEGQINNLEKGRYNIKFVFDNRYVDQIKTFEEKKFELK